MKKKSIKNLKQRAWEAFSILKRTEDCIRTTGCPEWGLCITCGKRYHIKLLQAGHFVPGRHLSNLFSEKGTHAQCYNCNINLKGNTLEYRRQVINLYGEGADLEIEETNKQSRQIKTFEYEAMIEEFNKRLKILKDSINGD